MFNYVFYMPSSLPLLHTAISTPCSNALWHSDPYIFFWKCFFMIFYIQNCLGKSLNTRRHCGSNSMVWAVLYPVWYLVTMGGIHVITSFVTIPLCHHSNCDRVHASPCLYAPLSRLGWRTRWAPDE